METEQNCNMLTPTLMTITAFLSRSPGLPNRWPGGPASLGHVPHSSIFSPNATAQSGVLRAPSAGCWFSLPHLISDSLNSNWFELQLTDFLSSSGLYNCSTPTFILWASQIALNSTRPPSRLYPDIPRTDAPVIYTGAFSYFDSLAGSEVNIQHRVHTITGSVVVLRSHIFEFSIFTCLRLLLYYLWHITWKAWYFNSP